MTPRIPHTQKLEGGLETHYYTTRETFEDASLEGLVSRFAEVDGVESPIVVLPDVSHKLERISPTGMTLATRGAIVPAAVPAANGSGIRVATLDIEEKDLDPACLERLLEWLGVVVPVYGEDSPALLRGRLREEDLISIYLEGARWIADRAGLDESFERIESEGTLAVEAASRSELRRLIPDYFFEQGLYDFGVLESGNHFIEIQVVDSIADPSLAHAAGVEVGQVVLMIHDGSPASLVGQYYHPVPYAKAREAERFERDKRLYHARFAKGRIDPLSAGDACGDEGLSGAIDRRFFTPSSPYRAIEPEDDAHHRFLCLMGMACNYGLANRLHLQQRVAFALKSALGADSVPCRTLTDTLHDCVKTTEIRGREWMVHRHGASEARPRECYSEGHPFARTGQLIGVPGAPGRCSFLAAAADTERSFYTANHGAGRRLDRQVARERFEESASFDAVRASGAALRHAGLGRFAGENPAAYKDVEEVISLAEQGGLLKGVARLRPIAIYKG